MKKPQIYCIITLYDDVVGGSAGMEYIKQFKSRDMYRVLLMMLLDIVIIVFSVWFTHVLRLNRIIPLGESFLNIKFREILILVLLVEAAMVLAKAYVFSWRYAGFREYSVIYVAAFLGTAASFILSNVLLRDEASFLVSDYAVIYLLCIFGFTTERFGGSMLRILSSRIANSKGNAKKRRIMVVGAGDTGSSLIKSMKKVGSLYPVVAIDDDSKKHGMRVCDVPVVGGRDEIPTAAKKYRIEEIIIAIPSGKDSERIGIASICRSTGLKTSTVPSLYELASGKANINQIREVNPQELLGRSEKLIDGNDIFGYIEGKVVLVTGGGGSIGSELCRQISNYNPRMLIVFDIYENNAYELQMELKRRLPQLKLEVLIGSVRDRKRLEEVFSKYNPKVVFHAAAHKHVPLMEDSPNEAIKNNVYGTFNVADMCEKYAAERFVLISTDKAVNPTNVMGASKRLAEMVMQRMAHRQKERSVQKTIYAAVRFGNVLGSNGSVIPLFKRQIREGGPITVTHPEINRFFMTIPEAVQLVMQAGAFAHGGEIFILDMGEPVKIVDLARNLIELSGYTPDVDIKIEFSGLRPGEKMYEELLLDKQRHTATKHDKIYVEQPIENDSAILSEIYALRGRLSCEVPIYDEMIKWMNEQFEWNSSADQCDEKVTQEQDLQ